MTEKRDEPILERLEHPEKLDENFIGVDPLVRLYKRNIGRADERIQALRQERTALLCIDMQYLDAARGYGVFAEGNCEVPEESQEFYFTVLDEVTLPNVRALQDAFRAHHLEVIHVRICSLTQNGRDRGQGHKLLKLHAPPGSKEAEFLPQVAPQDDEIVINKTASGVFNSTNLSYVLRNLGIESLFVTGVLTDECVSTTVRDACDQGYTVTLIEDGCASVTPQRHDFTVATLRDRYARVLTTAEAVAELNQHIHVEEAAKA